MKALLFVLSLFSSAFAHALVFESLNCKSSNGLSISLSNSSQHSVNVSYLSVAKPFSITEGPMFNQMTKTTNIGLADEALSAQDGDYSFYRITLNGELTISDSVQTAQGVVEYTYASGLVRIPVTSPKGDITCKYKITKDAFGE